jgi:hypothetical protein
LRRKLARPKLASLESGDPQPADTQRGIVRGRRATEEGGEAHKSESTLRSHPYHDAWSELTPLGQSHHAATLRDRMPGPAAQSLNDLFTPATLSGRSFMKPTLRAPSAIPRAIRPR